jgi:hypothetical protein
MNLAIALLLALDVVLTRATLPCAEQSDIGHCT